jgi:hypothetical protein
MKQGFRKGMRRLSGYDAGRVAKPVWLCRGCSMWHNEKPVQCANCGRLDFDHFHSTAEAKRWATLCLLERTGQISALERQVRLPLVTIGPHGVPKEWATFVADFRYHDTLTNATVVEDVKPAGGISYDAQLKIRCYEAMTGSKVRITTA